MAKKKLLVIVASNDKVLDVGERIKDYYGARDAYTEYFRYADGKRIDPVCQVIPEEFDPQEYLHTLRSKYLGMPLELLADESNLRELTLPHYREAMIRNAMSAENAAVVVDVGVSPEVIREIMDYCRPTEVNRGRVQGILFYELYKLRLPLIPILNDTAHLVVVDNVTTEKTRVFHVMED